MTFQTLIFFADDVYVPRSRRATPSRPAKINPALLSTYYLSIRITNKIFTESLKHKYSEDYKQLRKQVEQMLQVVYRPLFNEKFEGIFDIIFSNGSVIANSTLKFWSTNYMNANVIRSIFTTNIQTYRSKTFDLDVIFPEGQLLLEATLLDVTHLTASLTYTSPQNPTVPAIAKPAVVLFLLLVLIILLLVWWCCGPRNKDFSTYDQFNGGGVIPMYSTHSRFDVPNSNAYEKIKTRKDRTGTYNVNN
ncbi:hypothetical protein DPEC_G00147000 [Dallia pectoralis]|uniref:Uncharacterized protein n=1 Tax=Dallia pectoralis TaxID=75939 RepID=A0ACC2GP08_DALPE|nr:hypothetical protein DPEC_G00147000 [Dallia pectoralis]